MSTALTIDSSLPRNRKPQVFSGILLAKNQDTDDFTAAIPLSAGSGAPNHNAAVANEIYIRTDASDSDLLLYRAINTSGSWETVVGSELTDLLAATNAWTAANTFSHASGVTTNTLTERTAAAGVTIDGLLVKDGYTVFVDLAGSPTVEGQLAYNADHLEIHDGTAARIILANDDIGVTVQGYSATLAALANYGLDRTLIPTLTVVGGSGGDTAGTLALQLKRLDGSTNPAAARQVMIVATAAQYSPVSTLVSTVTFGTASTGSIIASGNGWCLAETDATGAFACVPSDSADETVYFRCVTAEGVADQTKGCALIGSNSDDAVWSA